MYDVIVVGGGFAGVTASRETARAGARTLLVEARERLGGRTWASSWAGEDVELGGAWVHWHQPHTWSEVTRAGLSVEVSPPADVAGWYVGDERRSGALEERDAIAERGWNRFVAGVEDALPRPHDPLFAVERLADFDRLSMAERLEEIELTPEERYVLVAELESVAHGPLDEAGAVSILRWHALSGGSLALAQFTGGRVTLVEGTGALLAAIVSGAPFETRLATPVSAVTQDGGGVVVHTRDGEELAARTAVVAVPLNALGAISFDPLLSDTKRRAISAGQASRGIKIFIRARGEPAFVNAIRPGHPFGYLDTEALRPDGTQLLIGFGPDSEAIDPSDLNALRRALDDILPGFEALEARAHDWVADEYAKGTWAIHRPGWYTTYHAEMRRPEGRVVLAGSDLANGWAGFMDGAIESGLTAAGSALACLAANR